MKIAVVYNRESKKVINLFGHPNREQYGLKNIRRITDALRKGNHTVISLEGGKDLIERLEEFMPRVLKGERPGMVFNLSYGIQGQARYTHVPGILEMVGVPYIGSGPLAHSLALDKVVAKMLFQQHDLPTPDFAVLNTADYEPPDIPFPLIVKPKNESTSLGMRIVNNDDELRTAVGVILDEFEQAALVEEYIAGREINVGLLGKSPPETFPPVEVHFKGEPFVYTLEDKKNESGREVQLTCPADLDAQKVKEVQEISRKAFEVLGCSDMARVDLRLARDGRLYILEINSLPSLGERSSYVLGAGVAGLDFTALINRIVEVACARYFGVPNPPLIGRGSPGEDNRVFSFITKERDRIERRLREWVSYSSRSSDVVGLRNAFRKLDERMGELGLRADPAASEERPIGLWETKTGLDGGTLLVCQVDVPIPSDAVGQAFRREPEWLHGEGIGASRGPLVMLEYALRAVKAQGHLRRIALGVLAYGDEGQDHRYSSEFIRSASARADRVLVLRPGTPRGKIVTARRGLRTFRLVMESDSRFIGQTGKNADVLPWLFQRLTEITGLSDRKNRIAVGVTDINTRSFPRRLPHQARATIQVSYPTAEAMAEIELKIERILSEPVGRRELALVSDHPPMLGKPQNNALAKKIVKIAETWEIPLASDTSQLPSIAGLVPHDTAVLCGLGPLATDMYTPMERISRISLVQRTLMLAQFLVESAQRTGDAE